MNCAIEVQRAMVERNAGVAPDKRIEFRIGIHLGDVVEESDGDLMGDGVNIAARLEGIAKPGGDLSLRGRLPAGARDGSISRSRSRPDPTQEHRRARSAFIRSRSASPPRPGARRRRSPTRKNLRLRPSNPTSLPSRSCRSRTSAAIPNRSISPTAFPRTSSPVCRNCAGSS